MDIFVFLLLVIAIYGIKFYPSNSYNPDFISKTTCLSLKGLLALIIILHHCSLSCSESSYAFRFFSYFGFLVVSIFFFISGYGLMKSFGGKTTQSFAKKHLVKIGIPFFVFNLLYYGLSVYESHPFSAGYIVYSYLVYGHPIIDSGWYFVVYILLLIVFYCNMRLKPDDPSWQIVGSLLFCLFWSGFCKWRAWGNWWHYSNYAYIMGLVMGFKEKIIVDFCKKHYSILLALTLVLFAFVFHLARENDNDVFAHLICSVITPILVFLLFGKFKFGNCLLRWLGKLSLELYLVHGIFLYHFKWSEKDIINCAIVMACSIVASYILHTLFSLANRKLLEEQKRTDCFAP